MHVSRSWRLTLISLVAAAAFLPLLGRSDVTNTHEARVAQTARAMSQSGWPWRSPVVEVPATRVVRSASGVRLETDPSAPPLRVNPWVVPVLSGEIRLQKPPLPYWCTAAMFRLIGENEWAVRVMPALMGAAATLLVYDLARVLLGRLAAWAAALVWASTLAVITEFRTTTADPYLAFFTLAAVWAWVRAATTRGRGTWAWLIAAYVALALGLLAKGPPLFVHVVAALAAFHVAYRARLPRGVVGHLAGLALLLAITLPWPLAVLRAVPDAVGLWRYESVGELAENMRNAVGWWGYLPKLPYLALPWTPLAAGGAWYIVARRRRRLWFPLAWFGAVVLFFSFVNLKKDAYLLPALAAQTLIVAQFVKAGAAWSRLRRAPAWLDALRWTEVGLAVGFAVVLVVLVWKVSLIAAVAAAAGGILALWRARDRRWEVGFAPLAAAFTLLIVLFDGAYGAARENARSPRPVAARVAAELAAPRADGTVRTLFTRTVPPVVAFYVPLQAPPLNGAGSVLVIAGRDGPGAEVLAAIRAESGREIVADRELFADAPGTARARWTVHELLLAPAR